MIGLRFTNGTTTVDVSNLTTGILTGYRSGNAPAGQTETEDEASVTLMGNRTSVEANLGLLEQLFVQVKQRKQRPAIGKVWVERSNGDGTWWKSELVNADALQEDNSLDRLGRSTPVRIVMKRKNFWKGAETQLPLTNGNGTDDLAGLRVFNCGDGNGVAPNIKHNWVQIDGEDILGDLPGPVRLEMTNSYDNAARLYNIWTALNSESDPANFGHILEGEAATGGTTVVNASCSNGNAQSFTWTDSIQAILGRWALDTTYLNRAGGNYFKVLAAFAGSPAAGTRLQCKVTFPSGTPLTVVGSSQEVGLSNARIQDIGTIQLPPWLVGAGDLAPVDLTIYRRKTGGGSLSLDYLQITPIDGYRVLRPKGYGTAYQIRVVDDGINETLYTDGWTPSGKTGHYVGTGERLRLAAGKTQRIYFLMSGDTGDISINRQLTVKAYYTPVRLNF